MPKETFKNIWIVWGDIVYWSVAYMVVVLDSEQCPFVNCVLFVAL